ncbi:hypothetical protein CR513_49633, partial [Mucuna pruriens]
MIHSKPTPQSNLVPPYLPPNYTPPVNNNIDLHTSTSNSQNQAQPQNPNFMINGTQTFFPPPTHDSPNHQVINLTSTIIMHPRQFKDPYSNNWLQHLEERLKAIEGVDYPNFNVANLCLIPDVIIIPIFKLPKFDKYNGNTCPKNHLIMYGKKMASCARDNKLLIHFFQESLIEQGHMQTWKDLVEAFLKQYKYNMDMTTDYA